MDKEIIPQLRGIMHLNAALALPSATFLMSNFATDKQWKFILPFSTAMEFQLIMSSLLHTVKQDSAIIRRIDHTAIFFSLYASSSVMGYFGNTPYTQISKFVMVVGVIQKLLRKDVEFSDIDRVVALALGAIWVATIVKQNISPKIKKIFYWIMGNLACMITIHALEWPKRNNAVFGYHEIMHLFSIINLVLGYTAVLKH